MSEGVRGTKEERQRNKRKERREGGREGGTHGEEGREGHMEKERDKRQRTALTVESLVLVLPAADPIPATGCHEVRQHLHRKSHSC